MDDEPAAVGLSQEKTDELRKLLPVLERRVRHLPKTEDFEDVASEVRQLRATIENLEKETALRQVVKSLRNIAEGIVGGVILELIPESVKSWVRQEIVGAPTPPEGARPRDERIYAVKVEIRGNGLTALNIIFASHRPFALTFSDSYMRVWTGADLAAILRLGLDKSWVEHPTKEEMKEIRGKPLRIWTQVEAQALKEEIARLILRLAGQQMQLPKHRPASGAGHPPHSQLRSLPGTAETRPAAREPKGE